MSIITREQIEHLDIERANLECIRDRTISDLQRGVVAAAYAGAPLEPLDLAGIREEVTELFAEYIAPTARREDALRAEIDFPAPLRINRVSHETKLRDAKDWLRKLTDGVKNANHSAEEALIRAYQAAHPGVFEPAHRVPSISEAAE